MHVRSLSILGTAILAVVVMGTRDTAVADAPDPAATEKRVEALEKIIVRDPTDASGTVLARLERIEKLLQINAKDAAVEQKTDAKTFDELKTSLITTQRAMEKLDRRLINIENSKLDRKSDELSDEVKALEKSILNHTTALRDLADRVKKLETVVRP